MRVWRSPPHHYSLPLHLYLTPATAALLHCPQSALAATAALLQCPQMLPPPPSCQPACLLSTNLARCCRHRRWSIPAIDQITIKTPNHKCRLYWCFNRVHRLEIQSVMVVFSTPLVCKLAPLYLLYSSPPPLPRVNKYRSIP